MATPQQPSTAASGSALLGGALLGALAGAGGLAWWLWRHSQQRQSGLRDGGLHLPRVRPGSSRTGGLWEASPQRNALPDRVQQLNQAIEEVRRQLEALQSQP